MAQELQTRYTRYYELITKGTKFRNNSKKIKIIMNKLN